MVQKKVAGEKAVDYIKVTRAIKIIMEKIDV